MQKAPACAQWMLVNVASIVEVNRAMAWCYALALKKRRRALMLLLALCGQTYTMDPTTPRLRRDTNHAIAPEERRRMEVDKVTQVSKVMIAAWVVTEETPFEIYSEFSVSHNSNDTKSITYACRPKGKFLIPCASKSILELSTQNSTELVVLLKQNGEQFELSQVREQSWYTHPVATHGAAVLSTILLMAALFH